MSVGSDHPVTRPAGEIAKLAAMLRRDFRIALSYRTAFIADIVNIAAQIVMFGFIGRLVDPRLLPTYGSSRATYMGFVAIGIAVTALMTVGTGRMTTAVRGEQMTGTLEMLLLTPTRLSTLQLGWIVYDLLYVPIRTTGFLILVTALFGVRFAVSGIVPASALLLAFVPFVWGIGAGSAGAMLTFRRGGGIFGYATMALAFLSGAYVPLDIFPTWVAGLQDLNPVAATLDGLRRALIGGGGWAAVAPHVNVVLPVSACVFLLGIGVFRIALRRELRAGSVGQY